MNWFLMKNFHRINACKNEGNLAIPGFDKMDGLAVFAYNEFS